MTRVFVTGGRGYIGSVLVPKLIDKGYDIVTLSSGLFNPSEDNPEEYRLVRGDIRDVHCLEKCLEGVDIVIHLAAISNDACVDFNPEFAHEVNVKATENLLKISKKSGIKRFIYASSGGVYGIKETEKVTEDLELNPMTTYSKMKALAESFVLEANQSSFTTTAIRQATACGYSPRMFLDLTVNSLTYQAISTGKITLFGGNQKRANIHIKDITDYYADLLDVPEEKISGEAFNAGAENYSILEIAKIIQKVIENVEIEILPSDDKRSYCLCSDKIRNALGFYPKRTVENAVADLKNAFENNLIPNPSDSKYKKIELMKKRNG